MPDRLNHRGQGFSSNFKIGFSFIEKIEKALESTGPFYYL